MDSDTQGYAKRNGSFIPWGEMNIVFATDEGYARHVATAIRSLEQAHPGRKLSIHVLDSGMSEASRTRLRGMAAGEVTVTLHELEEVHSFAHQLSCTSPHSTAVFCRLYLPLLLPEEQRALYLDADTVVLSSLDGLYHTDMAGKALLMVPDANAERESLRLGIANYFNSGVILFDLERCRKLRLTQQWLRYLSSAKTPPRYADQDVINVTSQAEIGALPVRYNTQSNPSVPGNTEDIRAHWNEVTVLHFISNHKPWLALQHPFEELYMQTILHTPWATDVPRIRRRKRWHSLRRWFVCWIRSGDRKTLRILGLPVFTKLKSHTHRTFYLFGMAFLRTKLPLATRDRQS